MKSGRGGNGVVGRSPPSVFLNIMNVAGYTLSGHYNNTEMFERKDANCPTCYYCGYRLDFFPHNPNYVFRKTYKPVYAEGVEVLKKTTALAMTYDGQIIVSKAFRKFCIQQNYQELSFLGFLHDREHFHLIVMPQLEVDTQRSNLRFENLCLVCQNYEWVGPSPQYLRVKCPLADGFYRSDLFLGSPHGRHPLIVVGVDTKLKLDALELKGLIFKPVYGLD